MLYAALSGFSGQGSALVAIIIATGIVNTWFLVGPSRLQGLWTTTYGQLLCVKLILFMGMLALAARNRFALTPAFGEALSFDRSCTASRAALRHSVLKETGLALLILALVAWLGRLAPTSALQ
ncbi:MAG: CopD family protein [Steroidobacteraceae bacterium]